MDYLVSKLNKALLGNTIVQCLEFEMHNFALIIHQEPWPSVDGQFRYGCGLNYFLGICNSLFVPEYKLCDLVARSDT